MMMTRLKTALLGAGAAAALMAGAGAGAVPAQAAPATTGAQEACGYYVHDLSTYYNHCGDNSVNIVVAGPAGGMRCVTPGVTYLGLLGKDVVGAHYFNACSH